MATRKKATGKLPRTIKRTRTQIKNTKSKRADRKRKALAPGKRLSKSGKLYTERRSNRSDKNKRKRL